jgi:hypothetical protein
MAKYQVFVKQAGKNLAPQGREDVSKSGTMPDTCNNYFYKT